MSFTKALENLLIDNIFINTGDSILKMRPQTPTLWTPSNKTKLHQKTLGLFLFSITYALR